MHPAWSRWLPCTVALLRVVPDPHRFPVPAWDELADVFEWDSPAWCDPGDPEDWIAKAAAGHGPGEEELAAEHAREHYDARVKLRAERIDVFTRVCHRAGIAPPATVTQLLECLVAFGLYGREESDGQQWLLPRLWRNPLDVLPFTREEAAEEASGQHRERAMLTGAGLRRLALADTTRPADAETVTVAATLRAIGEHAGIAPGQTRAGLTLLAGEEMVYLDDVDPDQVDLDTPVKVRLPWEPFERFFDFEELPAPEHFH